MRVFTKLFFVVFTLLLFSLMSYANTLTGYQGITITGINVTLANAATDSSLINTKGMGLVGIKTPSNLTGTAITFLSCASDGTGCVPVKSTTSGSALSYTVTTSSYYAIDPVPFYGIQYLKLKSGSSQSGDSTLAVSLKGQ